MQRYDRMHSSEVGRELMEEELATIYGGTGTNTTSTVLSGLSNLPSLPNIPSLPNLPGLPGVTNLGQITGLLGMSFPGSTGTAKGAAHGSSIPTPSLATVAELTGIGGLL